MKRKLIAAAVLAFATIGAANAGPLDRAKANAYLKAVAAGDVDALMQMYSQDAHMQWVGGQLDGVYRGADQIREVWMKFVKSNDGMPRESTVGTMEESANPRGATILVNADYRGKNYVKVRHVLVYRDGMLVNEIWQIDPGLQVKAE